MDRILSNKIEAVLLYDQFAVLPANTWHKLINEFSVKSGISFEETPNVKTPDFFHFLSDKMTVEVDYVPEPVVNGAFENSLSSQYTKHVFENARQAVDEHKSYVHICITNGHTEPPDPFIEEEMTAPEIDFQADDYDFAAELLRWLCIVQTSASDPLAAYWAQCDKLLSSHDFLKIAVEFKDPSLMVHPVLFSQINDETGQKENGLRTWGASSLIGCEIKIDCLPLPHEELMACVDHLIGITGVTGLMVPENHVFGRSEDEEIRVHYSMEDGANIVELEFERCEAFGINKTAAEPSDELNSFDLDDPTERAMFERIKSLREAADGSAASDHGTDEFDKKLNEPETWSGVKKKVDIASLRNLTKTAQSDDVVDFDGADQEEPDASEQPERKRFLKKVGGLFSKS